MTAALNTDLYKGLPPLKEPPADFEQVANFLQTAVHTRHNKSSVTPTKRPNHSSGSGYKAILDCLRSPAKSDVNLLYKVLRALQGGQVLATVFGHPQLHAMLIHFALKLHLFDLGPKSGVDSKNKSAGEEGVEGGNTEPDGSKNEIYDDVMNAHYHLLIAICSANSTFLHPVLDVLMRHIRFICARDSLDLNECNIIMDGSERSSGDPALDKVHATIQKILFLVPKAKIDLFPLVSRNFPHITNPPQLVKNYSVVAMQMWQYGDFIREDLVLLMLNKALEMDVEIRIEDNGDVILDDSKKDTEGDEENEVVEKQTKKSKTVSDVAHKLDVNMKLIFSFLDKQERSFYDLYMPQFIPTLLDVYKSKFVQFSFWYLMEKDACMEHDENPLYRRFISELIQTLYSTVSSPDSNHISNSTIMSTASYLASFCARARFVDTDSICEVLSGLLTWAIFYIQQKNFTRNKLFYSITQAIFYIMCYRGRQVMQYRTDQVNGSQHDVSAERFHQLFANDALNPLANCLSSVRLEFQVLGGEFGLIPESIVAATKKVKKKPAANKIMTPGISCLRNQLGGIHSQAKVSNPLDSFFPFDPYLLRQSSDCIRQYLYWEDVEDLTYEREGENDDESATDLEASTVMSSQEHHESIVLKDFDEDEDENSVGGGGITISSEQDECSAGSTEEMSIGENLRIDELNSMESWRKASIGSQGSW
uniref:RNA polymerase I-specific transcription initiation factor RRN3 n=1 Tax=Leptocylindrus danicus TaxID=163516 RepID=A0A7S2JXY6_9STRA